MNASNTPRFWKVVAIATGAVALAFGSVLIVQRPVDAERASGHDDQVSHFMASGGAVGDADPSLATASEVLKQPAVPPTALNVETF
jgi:hypothetical protein